MTKVPSLSYDKIVRALQRDGWTVVRQRGSHVRLQKRIGDELLKLTVPAHRPVKRSTLSHILKQARLMLTAFSNWCELLCWSSARIYRGCQWHLGRDLVPILRRM